jgi:peptidyl-prolyl cis-trans isomerase C
MANKKKYSLNYKISLVIVILILAISTIYLVKKQRTSKNENIIAYVNKNPVSEQKLLTELRDNYGVTETFVLSAIPDDSKKTIIKQIYTEQIIIDNAKKTDLFKSKDIQNKISQATNKIIKEAYLQKISQKTATRENIETLYQQKIKDLEGKTEVNAKHILVKNKSEALKISIGITNKSFEKTAKAKSIDPYSKDKGGDLGYFTEGSMVKEFEDIVFNMKKNQISKPFKTQFGWHIVKLIDKRQAKIPSLDEIYEKLKQELSYKAVGDYINTLQNEIDVELVKTTQSPQTSPAEEIVNKENS